MTERIPHANPAYDREMDKMARFLNDMEAGVLSQLNEIESAFADMDMAHAHKILAFDLRLNEMEGKALRQAIAVLACHHPVADDLRKVVGALYTAAEYERIGDYIKNMAKNINAFASHDESLKVFPLILDLIREVRQQFSDFIAARDADDLPAATAVWHADHKIDELFDRTVATAVDNQTAGDGNGYSLVHAVSAASNLERLGDRIKNLVEIFYYHKTGQPLNPDTEQPVAT